MNLHNMLCARAEIGRPIRVGLIGAGKFGSMYLAQARHTTGIHVVGLADLDPARARTACLNVDWEEERLTASSLDDAVSSGGTFITDDAPALIASGLLDVVIEATGSPTVGIRHALAAIEHGLPIIMATVEADVVAGPLLARKAAAAGVVYSLAYGDQPALICEHVDWARAAGFEVVCAGKGTRYHPDFHDSTPETVWPNFGWDEETIASSGANPKMFNSFIDGSKSAIEMTAVCNATGLIPQPAGLGFPPASNTELAEVCKPAADGGTLACDGTTEVVSSLNRDRSPVENNLQFGTYVVIRAGSDYVSRCFHEYAMLPDSSRQYAALYRPIHMIGLELGISVASTVLRKEPTGVPHAFLSDVAAVAKRDLAAGEILDGEGGYTVWGRQMPAAESRASEALPLGLAHNVKLTAPVKTGSVVSWKDVAADENDPAIAIRREMEAAFSQPNIDAKPS